MNADLEQAIKVTEWMRPVDQNVELAQALLIMRLTATNGKRVMGQVFSSVTVSAREARLESDIDALKSAKVRQAKLSLLEHVRNLLMHRTGLPGYRGYFKFQKVEPYE